MTPSILRKEERLPVPLYPLPSRQIQAFLLWWLLFRHHRPVIRIIAETTAFISGMKVEILGFSRHTVLSILIILNPFPLISFIVPCEKDFAVDAFKFTDCCQGSDILYPEDRQLPGGHRILHAKAHLHPSVQCNLCRIGIFIPPSQRSRSYFKAVKVDSLAYPDFHPFVLDSALGLIKLNAREKRNVLARGLFCAVGMRYEKSRAKIFSLKPAPTVKYLRLPLVSFS